MVQKRDGGERQPRPGLAFFDAALTGEPGYWALPCRAIYRERMDVPYGKT
jgi:hypothetical protein